jgi:hypothetical protein
MIEYAADSGVGSTILFNVDGEDARHLQKDLRGMVEADDLIRLKKFEAIARIDTEVVRIKTLGPLKVSADNCHEQIIADSHRLYYRPVSEVRWMLEHRSDCSTERLPLVANQTSEAKELLYEEF